MSTIKYLYLNKCKKHILQEFILSLNSHVVSWLISHDKHKALKFAYLLMTGHAEKNQDSFAQTNGEKVAVIEFNGSTTHT